MSPDDSGTCPQGYDVGHDVSLVGAGCCVPSPDASSGDTGSDAVSDAPSEGAVDATLADAGPADARGADAAVDAGGQ